jgi:hypothetical protein
MKIKEIIVYSHTGKKRIIHFNTDGLNIITGKSSTGKSTLSDIIEYCMGRSTFNIPEGPIRDKVSWYGVIFQFPNEQILIAKPTPALNASSCSRVMVRRGAFIVAPEYKDLSQNADDTFVVSLFSELIGIQSNHTLVPEDNSRESFTTTIKHTSFYLFQKQGLIANRDQLFYRQNESFIPQAIKDSLPILLGALNQNFLLLEIQLRLAKREQKIIQKQLNETKLLQETINIQAIKLISEAQQVGIRGYLPMPENTTKALKELKEIVKWRPTVIPDEDTNRVFVLETKVSNIRKERNSINEKIRALEYFNKKEEEYTSEAHEQKSRLESINALPYNNSTGEWQWPFFDKDINLESPIAKALINELTSLENELSSVTGERTNFDKYSISLKQRLDELNNQLNIAEEELAAAISSNAAIAEMGNRNASAARVIGRISLFLETYKSDDDLSELETRIVQYQDQIDEIESKINPDETSERLTSIFNIISTDISRYVKEFGAEFSEYPFRFDFQNLTVVADRPERPIPMNKTGGGENHLAYHLSALLAIHRFAFLNKKALPSFLFLDQPTQVYFPSETKYKSVSGSIEETERDSDLEKVRSLFKILYDFVKNEAPGFQIIVTEHANLRDQWFQDSIIEDPWAKPPALIPEEWENLTHIRSEVSSKK